MPRHLETGKTAELTARDYLKNQGMTFVEANYHCPRGEIDLVMKHADTTVFVEVRYRHNNRYGSGAESVDLRKQKKLLAAAAHYLLQRPAAAKSACRFDVVSLHLENGEPRIDWIADAFQAS